MDPAVALVAAGMAAWGAREAAGQLAAWCGARRAASSGTSDPESAAPERTHQPPREASVPRIPPAYGALITESFATMQRQANALRDEITRLKRENAELRAENARLGGHSGAE